MLVECWSHLGKVLISIRPMLSASHKITCDYILGWAIKQGQSYFLIDLVEIDNVKKALVLFGQEFTGQSRTDLIASINFLNSLNKFNPPEMYSTVEGCIAHEHIVKDGVCVLADGGVFPPIPPKPEDIKNETDCMAMNWYWYNGVCNVSPQTPEECKTYSECIRKGWFWYDNACHYTAKPPTPTPQPDNYDNKTDCEFNGFYWYNSKCNLSPETIEPSPIPIPGGNMFLQYAGYLDEYLKTLGVLKVIEKGIVVLLRNWLLLLGNFLIWLEKRGT